MYRALQEAEERRRDSLFHAVTSGNLEAVKNLLLPGSGLTVNERKYGRKGSAVHGSTVLGGGLLHACCGLNSPLVIQVAEHLLSLKNPALDLSVLDEHGLNVLLYAVSLNDSIMFSILMREREGNSERRLQLDVNERCGTSGWTALHYAADWGNLDMCKALIQAGALINTRATVVNSQNTPGNAAAVGLTPLDCVKNKIEASESLKLSIADISKLKAVADELNMILRDIDRVKQLKEQERAQKEAELAAERNKLLEKEQLELALLEKKQKQLKEKQERDRKRNLGRQ